MDIVLSNLHEWFLHVKPLYRKIIRTNYSKANFKIEKKTSKRETILEYIKKNEDKNNFAKSISFVRFKVDRDGKFYLQR